MVVWIIGLSGAGKTTLANEVITHVRKMQNNVILIDGDMIREIFGNDLGYTLEDRRINADRICKLGKFLDEQGINVVCAILSLFVESRTWNRKNLENYFEVYIDAPVKQLINRDSKGIYKKYQEGEITNVAGMDIDFPIPDHADMVIRNNKSLTLLLSNAEIIAKKIISGSQ